MRGVFRGNIVVSNLPEAFGDEDLAALFDPYGLVLGARIDREHPDPVQARRGVVALAPSERVEEAVQAMNGHRIDAYKLKVRKLPEPPKPARKAAAPKRPSSPPPAPPPPRLERPVVVVRQRLVPRRPVMAPRES
jgi:hypothetical protein